MIEYLEKKEKNEECSPPKKPKSSLGFLEKKKPKPLETADEVHRYLKQFLKEDNGENSDISQKDCESFLILETFESMPVLLKQFAGCFKATSKQNMRNALYLGRMLKRAHDMFTVRVQNSTWKGFLEREVGISTSYACKLMKIAESFGQYQKFYNLGISIDDLYRRIKQINRFMVENSQFKAFWQAKQ